MVDTHSHILWNVDDGPKTKEQSLEIIKQMVASGVTEAIITPHYLHPKFSVCIDQINDRIEELQSEIVKNQIELKIHTGHEVRLHERLLLDINEQQIYTLANSNYLLLELPTHSIPHYTYPLIQLLIAQQITPIIAHPERNSIFYKNPEKLEEIINYGAFAQVTAGSLCGSFGRTIQKFAFKLVKENLVHTYGSDVHNMTTRKFQFLEGLHYLEKQKLTNAAEILLINNKRILENGKFEQLELEILQNKWY